MKEEQMGTNESSVKKAEMLDISEINVDNIS
jgi:hypothetical protein